MSDARIVADRLRELRAKNGETQEQVAEATSTTHVSITRYESGQRMLKPAILRKLAEHYGVTIDYLLGREDVTKYFPNAYPMPAQNHLPIYGAIKCGPGGLAMEELLGYAESVKDPATHFCLMCYGDSMLPEFKDRDIVVIHQQEDIETGEIAAVIVDGEEGTLKRIVKQENVLTLVALNPAYPPRTFVGQDMNRVHIVGKVVKMMRDVG